MERLISKDKILEKATDEVCKFAAKEYPNDRKERIKFANTLIIGVLKTVDVIFT